MECEICEEEFKVTPNRTRFCSTKCRLASRHKGKHKQDVLDRYDDYV